jgi:hypothetical protein
MSLKINSNKTYGKHPDLKNSDPAKMIFQYKPVIKRWRLAQWWEARKAVLGKVTLVDYLRNCLARYTGTAPQTKMPPPEIIEISDNGEIVRRPNTETGRDKLLSMQNHEVNKESDGARQDAEPDTDFNYMDKMNRAQATTYRKRLNENRAKRELHGEKAKKFETELETREAQRHTGIENGEMIEGSFSVGRWLERASVRPSRLLEYVGWGILTIAIIAEAAQFWTVISDMNGISVSNLRLSFSRNPLLFLLCAFFSLCIASAMIWFVEVTFNKFLRLRDALGSEEKVRWRQVIYDVLVGVLAFACFIAVAYAGAHLRHSGGDSMSTLRSALNSDGSIAVQSQSDSRRYLYFFLITTAIPLAAGIVVQYLRGIARQRRIIEEAQQAEEKATREGEDKAIRINSIIRDLRGKLNQENGIIAQLESERKSLQAAAQQAEAESKAAMENERQFWFSFINSVHSALSLDRQYFMQFANRYGMPYLITPSGEELPAEGGGSPSPTARAIHGLIPAPNHVLSQGDGNDGAGDYVI